MTSPQNQPPTPAPKYQAPPARPMNNNSQRDQMAPNQPPCPVCGSTQWEQSPQQAQQDQYECGGCKTIITGKALKDMADTMSTDMSSGSY